MSFEEQVDAWEGRRHKLGDPAVGRRGESHEKQAARVRAEVTTLLRDLGPFFPHGLDFGCGWGRLAPTLAEYCGHLWLVDVIDEWVARAADSCRTGSPIVLTKPQLPLPAGSVQLVFDGMTLQSIDHADVFFAETAMLRRVLSPGGVFVSIHAAKAKRHNRVLVRA